MSLDEEETLEEDKGLDYTLLMVDCPLEENWVFEELAKLVEDAETDCDTEWYDDSIDILGEFNTFSIAMGMPIEGYVKEVIILMKKMMSRSVGNVVKSKKDMTQLATTKFNREIRRLECSVNYKSKNVRSSRNKRGSTSSRDYKC